MKKTNFIQHGLVSSVVERQTFNLYGLGFKSQTRPITLFLIL